MLIKIIVIALCTAFAGVILKSLKSELSVFVLLAGGILILLLILTSLSGVFTEINQIISKTGVSNETVKMLFKVVGIGFICEASSNICQDVGASNVAEYLLIGGRIGILIVCFPVIENLILLVAGLV